MILWTCDKMVSEWSEHQTWNIIDYCQKNIHLHRNSNKLNSSYQKISNQQISSLFIITSESYRIIISQKDTFHVYNGGLKSYCPELLKLKLAALPRDKSVHVRFLFDFRSPFIFCMRNVLVDQSFASPSHWSASIDLLHCDLKTEVDWHETGL